MSNSVSFQDITFYLRFTCRASTQINNPPLEQLFLVIFRQIIGRMIKWSSARTTTRESKRRQGTALEIWCEYDLWILEAFFTEFAHAFMAHPAACHEGHRHQAAISAFPQCHDFLSDIVIYKPRRELCSPSLGKEKLL